MTLTVQNIDLLRQTIGLS